MSMQETNVAVDEFNQLLAKAAEDLETLLSFVKDVAKYSKEAGTDPAQWESIAEKIKSECKRVLPACSLQLVNLVLHINAQCANMPLLIPGGHRKPMRERRADL